MIEYSTGTYLPLAGMCLFFWGGWRRTILMGETRNPPFLYGFNKDVHHMQKAPLPHGHSR